jgi:hypothetical protein
LPPFWYTTKPDVVEAALRRLAAEAQDGAAHGEAHGAAEAHGTADARAAADSGAGRQGGE